MVKKLLIAFLIGCPLALLALQAIQITPELNEAEAYENVPLKGMVNITHPNDQKVDISSFTYDKKPLKVEFIRNVAISDQLMISIYSFTLPGMKAGLQLVPVIGVKIGDKAYQSISTGFQVKAGTPSAPSPSQTPAVLSSAPQGSIVLKLEAFYHGDSPLFVGQRGWVGYRYIFNQSIALSEEEVPLLNAEGFKKIGGKVIEDHEQGDFSIREIAQQVEAIAPGTYRFGPSHIKGVAGGKTPVSAQADRVEITVIPFPEKGKPASFLGAVGQYTFDAEMVSSPEVRVGEKVLLAVTVGGTGNFATIKPPELCCQPGFSGRFQASDMPPVGKISADQVQFTMEVRPLSSAITEVPAIEFSYFDPIAGQYTTLKSNPIPLKVSAISKEEAKTPPPAQSAALPKPKPVEPENIPIEISGNDQLTRADLYNIPFGSWWSLAWIPVALGLIYLQYSLKSSLKKMKEEVPQETAEKLYRIVSEAKEHGSDFYYVLNRSFFLLFQEKGLLNEIDITPHKLPQEPPFDRVRAFLLDLEKRRFGTAKAAGFTEEDRKTYQTLFKEIKDQDAERL